MQPTFTAPGVAGDLTFSLIVSDGITSSAADTVTVTVDNQAPTAVPSDNIAVSVALSVTLDGRGSSDLDGYSLTYSWAQTGGPTVPLVDHGDGTATFTSPAIDAVLEFLFTVSDGDDTVTADISVTVQAATNGNHAPVADAGADSTVPRRSRVSLWGFGFDPDLTEVTHHWRQTAGRPCNWTTRRSRPRVSTRRPRRLN